MARLWSTSAQIWSALAQHRRHQPNNGRNLTMSSRVRPTRLNAGRVRSDFGPMLVNKWPNFVRCRTTRLKSKCFRPNLSQCRTKSIDVSPVSVEFGPILANPSQIQPTPSQLMMFRWMLPAEFPEDQKQITNALPAHRLEPRGGLRCGRRHVPPVLFVANFRLRDNIGPFWAYVD